MIYNHHELSAMFLAVQGRSLGKFTILAFLDGLELWTQQYKHMESITCWRLSNFVFILSRCSVVWPRQWTNEYYCEWPDYAWKLFSHYAMTSKKASVYFITQKKTAWLRITLYFLITPLRKKIRLITHYVVRKRANYAITQTYKPPFIRCATYHLHLGCLHYNKNVIDIIWRNQCLA